MKNTKKFKYILTRGILWGVILFLFFHAYSILAADKLSLKDYFSNLEPRDIISQLVSMIISGLILAWFIKRQIDNIKDHKQGD